MKKAPALAIVMGGKESAKSADSEPDMDDVSDDEVSTSKQDAADAAFDALKADDRGAFSSALSTYVKLCMKGD